MKLLSLTIGGGTPITAPSGLPQPGAISIEKIISNTLSLIITAGIVVSVIMIVWAGIQWVTSEGDKQKVAAARARLTWAIIGIIIMLISFFIISVINYLFGIQLLNFPF
jgi:uncharacterized BrkB/YihY/UPF0761 family membrane protein